MAFVWPKTNNFFINKCNNTKIHIHTCKIILWQFSLPSLLVVITVFSFVMFTQNMILNKYLAKSTADTFLCKCVCACVYVCDCTVISADRNVCASARVRYLHMCGGNANKRGARVQCEIKRGYAGEVYI